MFIFLTQLFQTLSYCHDFFIKPIKMQQKTVSFMINSDHQTLLIHFFFKKVDDYS